MDSASPSHLLSRRWARPMLAVYWPVLMVATHWPRLQLPETFGPWQGVGLDKLLHFFCFLVLTYLLIYAAPLGYARRWISNLVSATLMATAYALLDEWSQQWTQRTFDYDDLAANVSGVLALFVTMLIGHGRSSNEEAKCRSFVGHAVTVSGLTIVSRITGLLRESLLGAAFGLSGVSGAFMIGFIVPNLFRRLFGEGALGAAFIPIYTRLLKDDPRQARRLASVCLALMLIGLGGLTMAGELLLWAMLSFGKWSADSHLAIRLTMIMLPYMPMVCLAALLGGMLQVHGRFGVPAAAPILLNVVMIVGIYFVMTSQMSNLHQAIFVVAVCVLLAGMVQLVWLLAAAGSCASFTRIFGGTGEALGSMVRTMAPMMVGLAVFQINTLFDVLIAWSFSPREDGPTHLNLLGLTLAYPIASDAATTALVFAQRLYQFPLGVFGVAIATAIFPALARSVDSRDDFSDIFRRGLRLVIFIVLPASVGLILVRRPLVRVIFQYGQVQLSDVHIITTILTGYAAGVWAYALTHVITRALYAHRDVMTPLKISVAMVALNLLLNLTFIWFLGAAGLAWSTALCAMLQGILLLIGVRRWVDQPIDAGVRRSWLQTLGLTAIMTIGLVVLRRIMPIDECTRTGAMLHLGVQVVVGVGLVGLGSSLMKMQEFKWLWGR